MQRGCISMGIDDKVYSVSELVGDFRDYLLRRTCSEETLRAYAIDILCLCEAEGVSREAPLRGQEGVALFYDRLVSRLEKEEIKYKLSTVKRKRL